MIRDKHFISVVIPTLGRDTLSLCITALGKQTHPPDEIIIVKDVERRGASWARNEGIWRSCGNLIAFTDDDCIPPEDWLEHLIQAIDEHGAAGAGGTFQETDPFLIEVRRRRELLEGENPSAGNGGNILYRREWLEKCIQQDGYAFDESFNSGSSEDWELVVRLRQRDAKLVYVPAKVVHLRQASPWQHLRHQFTRGVGIAHLYLAQRTMQLNTAAQHSLLWDQSGTTTPYHWMAAFWRKAIGPFDLASFSRMSYFWLFWLGEKFQGAGFLWGLIVSSLSQR